MIEEFEDSLFGHLSWDGDLNWWTGMTVAANGTPCRLHISTLADSLPSPPDGEDADQNITEYARSSFARIHAIERAARVAVARRFIPLYAEWHDDEQIAPLDFDRRISVASIHLSHTGSAQVAFYDDDMFHGHFLSGHIAEDGSIERASMDG